MDSYEGETDEGLPSEFIAKFLNPEVGANMYTITTVHHALKGPSLVHSDMVCVKYCSLCEHMWKFRVLTRIFLWIVCHGNICIAGVVCVLPVRRRINRVRRIPNGGLVLRNTVRATI
jgi:hypothetical protein